MQFNHDFWLKDELLLGMQIKIVVAIAYNMPATTNKWQKIAKNAVNGKCTNNMRNLLLSDEKILSIFFSHDLLYLFSYCLHVGIYPTRRER